MIAELIKNTSGTVAIASTSTSMGVAKVIDQAPNNVEPLINMAQQVISVADIVGICSVTVLALSFLYTIIATNKRHKDCQDQLEIDKKFYALRKEELKLEQAKFKQGVL